MARLCHDGCGTPVAVRERAFRSRFPSDMAMPAVLRATRPRDGRWLTSIRRSVWTNGPFFDGKVKNMRSATDEPARTSAFEYGRSTKSINDRKVASLQQELDALRNAFENTICLLKASRRELLAIRKEAISVADQYQASNEELVAINRDLRELLERSGASAQNPPAALYVDLRSLFSNELRAPPTGAARVEKNWDANRITAWHENAARRIADLTPRQRQIMVLVVNGQPSKIIAADLHISQRTVENHRAQIMKRTESKSLPALARLALFALTSSAGELLEVAQPQLT